MYSALGDAALPAPGFPIRRSTGQRLFSASPWLIAAVHVLLRLLVPRHPPCALTILTVSTHRHELPVSGCFYLLERSGSSVERSKASTRINGLRRIRRVAPCGAPSRRPSHECLPSAVFKVHGGDRNGGLPPASLKTEQRPQRTMRRSKPGRRVLGLPRKEVIQPQLPLRLPCYDFTPITSPTFDGSLP